MSSIEHMLKYLEGDTQYSHQVILMMQSQIDRDRDVMVQEDRDKFNTIEFNRFIRGPCPKCGWKGKHSVLQGKESHLLIRWIPLENYGQHIEVYCGMPDCRYVEIYG